MSEGSTLWEFDARCLKENWELFIDGSAAAIERMPYTAYWQQSLTII